jgi:hypothetical protein
MSQLTLELMKRALRKEHPSMLTTVYCLAYFDAQGRKDKEFRETVVQMVMCEMQI